MTSRRATRACTRLRMDFDRAVAAFNYQAQPGWEAAAEELRDALREASVIGDADELPCPLAWYGSVLSQVRCWLDASADVRRGLTGYVLSSLKALAAYQSHTIAEPEQRLRGGVR